MIPQIWLTDSSHAILTAFHENGESALCIEMFLENSLFNQLKNWAKDACLLPKTIIEFYVRARSSSETKDYFS